MRLNIIAFALACGLTWGAGMFVLTWRTIAFDGAIGEATLKGQFYPGYTASPLGSIIGLVWGLVEGAVAGGILAWLYNWLACRVPWIAASRGVWLRRSLSTTEGHWN
jgi:hypothetical protein